ncbi:tripartite tricarboxylate transporter substrate binding protein [Schlegelella sp. S2-27]|uniref:Tripartite tricarboxylate transporter substrate binding protein n=1 Tax=Caldimonas mangrovi TaxID=2944811 RepID=A0ABT0YSX9_9BURK|nr:tripartite tricarboxylate transporter substrate binding protein [Caldimonas mangrovi]MCM5681835.1 tripartite tricarboxylate transporter substrate binding protein [Caldimonas mangrovi]
MSKISRRAAAALLLVLAAGVQNRAVAQAAAYPSRPVRILVGYSAGGAVDIIARAVAQQMTARLGQQVIVENKPGGGTNIALRALIDSPADGYTLMLAANALAANVTLYQPAPYRIERDITPIAQVGQVPVVLAANADSKLPDFASLVTQAKKQPDAIGFGSPGNGSTPHLAVEMLERAAGIQLMHVPYKGGAQAMNDVVAGHIPTVAVNALEALPHVRSGKLRVLAVLSAQRSPLFPEVPTIAESGFAGFEASVWYGLIGPAGLSADIVKLLHAEVQRALASNEVRERLSGAGGQVRPGPTSAFVTLLDKEQQRYARLITDAHIKPD